MKQFLIFSVIIICQYSYSQIWDADIRGKVTTERADFSDITVVLFKNKDTIAFTRTDTSGYFSFFTQISNRNEYSVKIENQNRYFQHIVFRQKEDTVIIDVYEISLSFNPVKEGWFDPTIYYEFNDVRIIWDDEIEWFKALLKEFPTICIRFAQTINSKENQEIGMQRMKYFKQYLIRKGFDLKNFSFTDEIYLLDGTEPDNRSRIQGVVISTDAGCE